MAHADYQAVYDQSIQQPDVFWAEAAEAIHWDRRWDRVLDDSRKPFYRWFVGGRLNTCYNAIDRHVLAGRGEQPAVIYDSPVTGTVETYTYRRLRDLVARFAGALVEHGVQKGDRVVIYMPMIPQALVAVFACARIGAVHSVVFGGFAPRELATRIDDAKPRLIVSASCGIETNRVVHYKPLLDEGIKLAAHKPEHCIIFQRPQTAAVMVPQRDLDWNQVMDAAHPDVAECAVVGVADELKGEVPVGFAVLKAGVNRPEADIVKELIQAVRDKIGPVASFKTAAIVERLPKTRSGKILRGTMKRIADGTEYTTPATIDDPAILDEIADSLVRLGYPKKQA
ncbi:MAG: AMP-binding protein [Phycisphaerales bacterium]|nr:MAG: AMP-binding protein [Phycisphaerales bacterium]